MEILRLLNGLIYIQQAAIFLPVMLIVYLGVNRLGFNKLFKSILFSFCCIVFFTPILLPGSLFKGFTLPNGYLIFFENEIFSFDLYTHSPIYMIISASMTGFFGYMVSRFIFSEKASDA